MVNGMCCAPGIGRDQSRPGAAASSRAGLRGYGQDEHASDGTAGGSAKPWLRGSCTSPLWLDL